ncbi:CAP domain-containing protein [Lentibacillus halophilus]|uniref:CAP domain-containing protein n=1 Tax=Lentibacillus halophilus TaxID=295065 RepID=A0ABN0ZFG7_9BACI
MRFIRIVILAVLVISGIYYIGLESEWMSDRMNQPQQQTMKQKNNTLKTKSTPDVRPEIPYEGQLFQWIGKETDALEDEFGKPVRKDLSPYGYESWVYTNGKKNYIQFALDNQTVTSVYATGDQLSLDPIHIGQSYASVKEELSFSEEVNYSEDSPTYSFHLRDDELASRPLVKVTDDIFMQLYFDRYTDKLVGVRALTADVLLLRRPYELNYRGELPEKPRHTSDEQQQIDQGMERQIFLMTNVIRNQHKKQPLKWDEAVGKVAYRHSKDMADNNYFSHYNKDGDGLKERLATKDVFYKSAGENIAAQYPDAQAAMHGWLNSEGHREALLKDEYTHLGAGVYKLYYTQNFVTKQ